VLCASSFVLAVGERGENGVWAGNDRFNGYDVNLASWNNLLAVPYDGDVFEGIDESYGQGNYPAFELNGVFLTIAIVV